MTSPSKAPSNSIDMADLDRIVRSSDPSLQKMVQDKVKVSLRRPESQVSYNVSRSEFARLAHLYGEQYVADTTLGYRLLTPSRRELHMRRTLPKDVVRTIESTFSWTRGDWRKEVTNRENARGIAPVTMPGILEMIDRIPEDLMVFDSATDSLFTMALAALRANVAGASTSEIGFQWPAFPLPGRTEHEDCLVMVKNILAGCPEDVPSSATEGMTFISDAELRQSLLVDLGSAERLLNTGEWKACTVLSGSIIEALLLWVLQRHSAPEIAAAIASVDASKQIHRSAPPDNLTDGAWRFHDYIHVAAELQEIQNPLYSRCVDAKDYRNLIHPAVAERRNAACDRGTSHITIGTVYALIKKLEQSYATPP